MRMLKLIFCSFNLISSFLNTYCCFVTQSESQVSAWGWLCTSKEINAPSTTRCSLVLQTISGVKKHQMSMLAAQHVTTKDVMRSQLRQWERQTGPACIRKKKKRVLKSRVWLGWGTEGKGISHQLLPALGARAPGEQGEGILQLSLVHPSPPPQLSPSWHPRGSQEMQKEEDPSHCFLSPQLLQLPAPPNICPFVNTQNRSSEELIQSSKKAG